MDLISPLQFPTAVSSASSTAQDPASASREQQDAFLSALTTALGRPGVLADADGDDDGNDDGTSLRLSLGT